MSDQAFKLNFVFEVTKTEVVKLQIVSIDAGSIVTGYSGLDQNDPVANGNKVFVWKGEPSAIWSSMPIAESAATGSDISLAGNYDASTFTVGYSVGPGSAKTAEPSYRDVVATARIPETWDLSKLELQESALGIAKVRTGSIQFRYALPEGATPRENGSWIGLWTGNRNPFKATPTNTVVIPNDTDSGTVTMTGLGAMSPGGHYTAALFSSGYDQDPSKLARKAAAVLIQFEISAPTS